MQINHLSQHLVRTPRGTNCAIEVLTTATMVCNLPTSRCFDEPFLRALEYS